MLIVNLEASLKRKFLELIQLISNTFSWESFLFMRVEACCQALLEQILPAADEGKTGLCIDVGVGTFAFYCERFTHLGFQSVAVEPLPSKKLRYICQRLQIHLIEGCLSDINGSQDLHLGRFIGYSNRNFSSLNPNWFGASNQTKQVQSITLSSLLALLTATKITCLKLDVEGWESAVIKQFAKLPEALLPTIIMFEYGGGANRQSRRAGWSSQFLSATRDCLSILKDCNYGLSVIIDFAPDTKERILDLQTSDLNLDTIFSANSVYGNIICCRHFQWEEIAIKQVCTSYYDGLVNRFFKAIWSFLSS